MSEKYKEGVALCEMDGKDFEQLSIKPGTNVKVSTKTGSVILKSALATQPLRSGTIFIPYGPYANALIGTSTEGTGMPSFKGVKAELEPAPGEEVLDVKQLLFTQFKKGGGI